MSFYENFLMVLIIIFPKNLIKTELRNINSYLKTNLKSEKYLLLIFFEWNEMIEL